jgi:hypothetical protein
MPRTLGVCGCLGVLRCSCSVSALESVSGWRGGRVRAWFLPACRGEVARGSTARGLGGRGGSSFLAVSCRAVIYPALGANTVTRGFPVTVFLVAAVCRNFGRAFWVHSEWRSRPGTLRVCSAARAAASAAAAIAPSDDDAVTWEDVMERTA